MSGLGNPSIYLMEVGRRYWGELIVFLANTRNAISKRVAFESGRSRLACFPHASVLPRYSEPAQSSKAEPGVLKPNPKPLVKNSEPEN